MQIKRYSDFIKEDMVKKEESPNKKYSSYGMQDFHDEDMQKQQDIRDKEEEKKDPKDLDSKEYGDQEHEQIEGQKKELGDVLGNLEKAKGVLDDLDDYLDEIDKINNEPLKNIISQITAFMEIIENEIKNLD
jgi:hypothetical protein